MMKKRLLSLLLCAVMMLGIAPVSPFADMLTVTSYAATLIESLEPQGSDSLVMTVNEVQEYSVTVFPLDATNKTLNWSTSDKSVATVVSTSGSNDITATADITAVGTGTAKITYVAADGSGVKGSFTVEVRPLITSLTVTPAVTVITPDTTNAKLTATIKPTNAGNQVLDWISSNTDVCVVDHSGKLVPKSIGECQIYAIATDGSNKNDTVKVRVAAMASAVSIGRTALNLDAGDTYQLSASVTTVDGKSYTDDVSWSSDDKSVVSVDSNGKLTAKKAGTATIKAEALDGSGKYAVCVVDVVQPVEGVSLPSAKTVYTNSPVTLTPTFTPSNPTNKKVTWKSSNTAVATVSSSGVVTGVKEGTATIYCTTADGNFTAKCNVTVAIAATGVTLNKTTLSLDKGETYVLAATVSPSSATDRTVTWKSSNTKVATVASNGVVTAVAGGSCTVTATTHNGKTAKCTVNVVEEVSGVSLASTSLKLYHGQTYTLKATVLPTTATNKGVSWHSSDTSVVTVTTEGVLTAVSEGTATITVTTDQNGYTASCAVTVRPKVPVTGITLDTKSITLKVDEKYTFLATVTPSNASDKSIKWTRSNTNVNVSQSGVIRGMKPGTAIITATTEDGGYQYQCKVTVVQPVTGVRINATSVTLDVEKTKTLTANVLPSDATNKSVKWSTSNKSVVTVSSKGVITAVKAGTATVTAITVDGSFASSCRITVVQPVTGIKLSSKTVSVAKGKTTKLTATVVPSNATNQEINWVSSNKSVATVDSSGKITAKAKGTAKITATTEDGAFKKSCTVEVVQLATSLKLNYSSITLDTGKKKTLSATLTPATVSDKTVVWKSSNKKVAKVSSKGVITAVGAGTATITCTSGDGNVKKTCKVTVRQPATGVELSASKITVKVGKKKAIVANVLPQNATNSKVTWKSSDTNIATVDENGVVKGIKPGTATITVTTSSGGFTDKCKVTVARSVTGLKLNKTSMTINVGKSSVITPKFTPSDATNQKVTWSSSNYDVADVTKDGKVVAKSAGYAVITAKSKDGGYTASCKVYVVQPVTKITLNKKSVHLEAGEKYTLKATIAPENASDKEVKWTSSNKKIAKVSSKGVVTAIKEGTVTITCKAVTGGVIAKCTVKVVVPVTGIKLNKTYTAVYLGKTRTLKATVSPAEATVKDVKWYTSDKTIAKVSQKGVITPVKVGTVTITAKTVDGSFKATCTVRVKQAVEGITLNKTKLSLNEGKKYTLKATITPSDATDKTVTWKSSNSKIAAVDKNGVVSFLNAGTATITATSSNGLKATCKITVKEPATGIKLNKSYTAVYLGKTRTLTATVLPSDASNKKVIWSSSDKKIATVNSKGVITPVKVGTVTITAKTADGGFKATCKLVVKQAVEKITLNKTSFSLNEGRKYRLKATILPSDASNKKVIWSSSDKKIATVNSKGVITPVKVGTVTITAKTADGGFKATCKLVVKQAVEKITLNKTSFSLNEGRKYRLKATISPSDATDKTVTWKSSNSKIVSVDKEGVVTLLNAGTATITATSSNGLKATCKITVKEPVTGVKLNKSKASVDIEDTLTLKATVSPSDATNKSIKWYTSDKKIAKVSQKGVVTPVKPGTVTITVKTVDGSFKAKCVVSVEKMAEKLTLNKSSVTRNAGKSYTLKATLSPSDATNTALTWKSSDKTVATVSSAGVVKLLKAGTVTITAKTSNGLKASCKFTVTQPVTGVKLNKTAATVYAGDELKLKATVLPTDANNKNLTWSSSDTAVAKVSSKGVLSALKAGTAVITAKTEDGGYTAKCTLTVKQHVTAIKLNKASVSLLVGGEADLTATISPSNATDKTYTFISSNPQVVTVDSKGHLVAKKLGTATVTVRSNENGKTASCTVKVVKPAEAVELIETALTLSKGGTAQLKATVSPADATNKNVIWETSDSSVISVKNGLVTALKQGTAHITVTTEDGGFIAYCTVTVK